MSHSIQLQIRSIARQARRLLLVHGICQFGLVIISTAFLAGLIDYVLRLQDQGIRLIISSMFGLTLIWSFRRFVLPSFHRRFGEVEVAEHVERRFPELGDQLSSSLSFLIGDQTANQAESATLRQSVISQTEALVRQLRLQECLDRRSTRRAVITCLLMLLAIGCICLMDREGASLAVRRLATPWSRDAWPRRNSLEIVNPPERIALGQDFEIEVVDIHDRLPKDATIHLWFEGDRESEIETALARRGEGRFHYTRNNVARAFKYRVTGGDDDSMEWKSLQVVEPVRIVDFRAVVEPPTYSGIKASESEIAAIRVLEGSRVTLHGRTDRPLRAARAIVSIDGVKEVIEAEVNAKENAFVVTSLPTGTACKGQYWIELEEADGVVSEGDTRASWEIVPDRSPLVTVVTPTNDAYFTPDAILPIRVSAADDLAIQGLMVHVGEATIPLYVGSESPPACDELPEQADVREVTRALHLREFQLAPDDTLQLTFFANDYKPQSSEPATKLITIVSREDFDYLAQERQKLLLGKLVEALRLQRATQAQLMNLQRQIEASATWSTEDVGRIRATELQQQQVGRWLDDSPGGAARLVAEQIASFSSNQLMGTETAVLMEQLAKMLDRINLERLPELDSEFVRATKTALAGADAVNKLEPLLASIIPRQEAVAADLQTMVEQLSRWDDYRRFARDVAQMLQAQRELSGRVRELSTIGQRFDLLSAQQQSELRQASGEQIDLAQRLDRVRTDMGRLSEALSENNPTAAASLADAAQEAGAHGISERMREIAGDVASNRLGNASQAQSAVEQGLQQMLGALTDSKQTSANDPEHPTPQQLAAGLAQLKTRLSSIASRQQELLELTKRGRDAGASVLAPSQMALEQRQLGDELRTVREQLPIPKVFALGMKTIETVMLEAASRLERDMLDDVLYGLQTRSLLRLEQLIAALEPQGTEQSNSMSRDKTSGSTNDQAANASDEQRPKISLEELRLLHMLQIDLYERTAMLNEQRQASGPLGDEGQKEMQRIATEQGDLAELLLEALSSDEATQSSPGRGDLSEPGDDLDRALEGFGIPGFGGNQ